MEWIRFLFLFRQDYQEFFRLRRGPFGRRPHYPNDPVNPVQLFSLKKESIPLFKLIVSYLIRLDARGQRSAGGGTPET
jgi:hypothetical protein